MDSLAYSVMLEIKTNTASLNKDLNKSLGQVTDYHKQIQNTFNSTNREVRRYVDYHRGANKVLSEQAGIWDTIKHAVGSVVGFILSIPGKIIKTIGGIAVEIVKATASGIVSSIAHIDKYIDEASKRYDKMLETYRYANFQAASGVSMLHSAMTSLVTTLGVTFEEAESTVIAMQRMGLRAEIMGAEFLDLATTITQFERMTGVSAETSARLSKTLQGMGFSVGDTHKMFEGFLVSMKRGRLTTQEMNSVIQNLQEEMFRLEFSFGTDAVEEYADTLGELAGVAKMVGVEISRVTKLMSELNRTPMKFIVALGDKALFRTASENVEVLAGKVGEMKAMLEGIPPGLQPGILEDMYGIDFATMKVLEGIDEFRKKFPDIVNATEVWNDMWGKANQSLGRLYELMYNKIMGVFNHIARQFMKMKTAIFDALIGDIPERIQAVWVAISELIDKVFDINVLGEWGAEAEGWAVRVAASINEWFGDLLNTTHRWITALTKSESIEVIRNMISQIHTVISEQLIPAVMRWYDTIEGYVVKALKWVWGIITNVVDAFNEWVDGGGPERLYEWMEKVYDAVALVLSTFWKVTKVIAAIGAFIVEYFIWPLTRLALEIISKIASDILWVGEKLIWVGGVIKDFIIDPAMQFGTYWYKTFAMIFGFMYDNVIGIGKAIYDHLIEPIGSIAGSIADAISGVLTNTITTIKSMILDVREIYWDIQDINPFADATNEEINEAYVKIAKERAALEKEIEERAAKAAEGAAGAAGAAKPEEKVGIIKSFSELAEIMSGGFGQLINIQKKAGEDIADIDRKTPEQQIQKQEKVEWSRLAMRMLDLDQTYQDVDTGLTKAMDVQKVAMNELEARIKEAERRGEKIDPTKELKNIWTSMAGQAQSQMLEVYKTLSKTGLYADQELEERQKNLKALTYKMSKMTDEEIDVYIENLEKSAKTRGAIDVDQANKLRTSVEMLGQLRKDQDKQLKHVAEKAGIGYEKLMKGADEGISAVINRQRKQREMADKAIKDEKDVRENMTNQVKKNVEDQADQMKNAGDKAAKATEDVVRKQQQANQVIETETSTIDKLRGFAMHSISPFAGGSLLSMSFDKMAKWMGDAEASEIPSGAAAGAKSEHVATAPKEAGEQKVKLDDGELKSMVDIGGRQVDLLASIDGKVGKNLYNRNQPSYHEVTSTVWGQ